MNSLDDLIRDTLAERAHDVDGVDLRSPASLPLHRGRRLVAIGTVVAVAAAIVTAVVLLAPWRGTPDRTATPPAVPSPPAGMQWVSYHGITLTVPESWQVTTTTCPPTTEPMVQINDVPCSDTSPPGVQLTLRELGDDQLFGEAVTIGGHPARRSDMSLTSEPPQAYVQVQLPDAGVSITLYDRSNDTARLQTLLDGIEYTPVDHYGCTAQQSTPGSVPAGDLDLPADITSGVVCEYGAGTVDHRGLTGSRALTGLDIAALREIMQGADPDFTLFQPMIAAPGHGLHVYLLTRADGTLVTVTADPGTGEVLISDGEHGALAEGRTIATLPGAYPDR